MRLAKYLSRCGVASRRASEDLIRAGKVKVDGEVVKDPARAVIGEAEVTVDGASVRPEVPEVWALNKPAGVVSTASDPGGRATVVDLVPSKARLYPVGRLVADSRGLILVSNDGPMANHLTHPRYEVHKTYRARVKAPLSDHQLSALRAGPNLDDGPTSPVSVTRVGADAFEIILGEGRNRQVRRMAEAVGAEVVDLVRVAFGSMQLGDLREGEARKLGSEEVGKLWKDGEDDR